MQSWSTKLIRNIFAVISILIFSPTILAEEIMKFSCSWEKAKPINITVDLKNRVGSRDDGGMNYRILKVTPYALWMEVVDPIDEWKFKIQMIEVPTDGAKAGRWVDTVHSTTGWVSSIDGGVCWKKSA
tara:strand:- start:383 stop:766 length:384 start_codon:yes stop_codon:yes gene_type:complete